LLIAEVFAEHTLVTLMGYRNQTLYERLPGNGI
jgi:hypothetical protein